MTIRVLTFGIVRELCGSSSLNIVLDEGATVDVLRTSLITQYPALKQLASFMIAVNNEYAPVSLGLSAGDEVAIIPPVSGG